MLLSDCLQTAFWSARPFLHILDNLIPLHAFPARNQETEPAGPGMRAGFRKNQLFLCSLKSCLQAVEIVTAPLHKGWEFIQLGASNGGLHIRCLQVIPEMGIHVFVVIPQGKLPNCLSNLCPHILSRPEGHTQSRPQSRKDRMIY